MMAATCCGLSMAVPADKGWKSVLRETSEEFFTTDSAKAVGERVLAYQRVTGGWAKNINIVKYHTPAEIEAVVAEKGRVDDSTTDNGSTTMQILYLARLYNATHEAKYLEACRRGVDYLLVGQYDNGGWPQFWPNPEGYQIHITYNDDAMACTMMLLKDVGQGRAPFADSQLFDEATRSRAAEAFDKGVACILRTQIVVDGEPTVWCQQHYRDTYEPAPARTYELPSYCSQESVTIVKMLMEIENPSSEVIAAVDGAMKWFDRTKLAGLRIERTINEDGSRNTRLVEDPDATPLWARFYDLESCTPYVCDRDGIPRRNLEEIGSERRNGYSWYNDHALELYPLYDAWRARLGNHNNNK